MKTRATYSLILSGLLMLSLTVNGQNEQAIGPSECTLHLNDQSKVPVTRFWRIDEYTVEYEHDGSLHDVPVASVQRIQCENAAYIIRDQRLLSVDSLARVNVMMIADTLSPSDRYQLGRKDGDTYYHGGGAFVGGLLTAPTLVGPIIIAAVRPPLDNPKNPNLALLHDPDYRKGYRKAAHGKKAAHVVIGVLAGFVLLMAAAGQ